MLLASAPRGTLARRRLVFLGLSPEEPIRASSHITIAAAIRSVSATLARTRHCASSKCSNVPQVMHRVVQAVGAKGLHREVAAVGTSSGPIPLRRLNGVESVGVRTGGVEEFPAHDGRHLKFVAFLDGGFVLIPVLKDGPVFFEHQAKSFVEDPIDVTHVTGVLEGRPPIVTRSNSGAVTFQDGNPLRRVLANGSTKGLRWVLLGVKAARFTGPFEDPGPVLGIGRNGHRSNLTSWRHGGQSRDHVTTTGTRYAHRALSYVPRG